MQLAAELSGTDRKLSQLIGEDLAGCEVVVLIVTSPSVVINNLNVEGRNGVLLATQNRSAIDH